MAMRIIAATIWGSRRDRRPVCFEGVALSAKWLIEQIWSGLT